MFSMLNFKEVNILKLPKLNQSELNYIKQLYLTNENFNIFIDKLYTNKIVNSKKYTVKHSCKISGDNYEIHVVVLSISSSFILCAKLDNRFIYFAIVPIREKNSLFLKIYALEKNSLTILQKIKYSKSNKPFHIIVPKKISIPIYGNWCGPGYSGPAAPIDDIDKCCKMHDNCYKIAGKGSKYNCDMDLICCLNKHYKGNTLFGKFVIKIIVSFFTLVNLYK